MTVGIKTSSEELSVLAFGVIVWVVLHVAFWLLRTIISVREEMCLEGDIPTSFEEYNHLVIELSGLRAIVISAQILWGACFPFIGAIAIGRLGGGPLSVLIPGEIFVAMCLLGLFGMGTALWKLRIDLKKVFKKILRG